jgi:glutamate---cysteine ligase / carboxylate-amine ligase
MNDDYSFGIEEEYFLSGAEDRGALRNVSPRFIAAAKAAFPREVQTEMLQSQLEIATLPATRMEQARDELIDLRSGLSQIAGDHGLLLMAAGTHPSAVWTRQRQTATARYDKLMRDLQMLGSRNQVCGLHIHVEIPDPDRRVDVMVRLTPFLPLLLALSTSSPFWQTHRTGLMGYRLSAYRELPRTGLPEMFETASEYQRYVDTMVAARAIDDSSFLWWSIRPSLRHPTLELRVCDSCTRLYDVIAIAALFRCLVRRVDRDPALNANPGAVTRALASENIWRAQRYGTHGGLIDENERIMKPVADVLDEVLALVAEDAQALDCVTEVMDTRRIIRDGTSADMQLAVYEEAYARTRDRGLALAGVVDWLAAETSGRSAVGACKRARSDDGLNIPDSPI